MKIATCNVNSVRPGRTGSWSGFRRPAPALLAFRN